MSRHEMYLGLKATLCHVAIWPYLMSQHQIKRGTKMKANSAMSRHKLYSNHDIIFLKIITRASFLSCHDIGDLKVAT